MKVLVVPLDFSDATDKVLEATLSLATALSAQVYLLHVVEPIATAVPVGASMDVLSTSTMDTVQEPEVFRKRLEDLALPLREKGIHVECEAVLGLASEDIVAVADRVGAEMIVLGSHGHGALYHLFAGSVSTATLKHSKCPVLFVPVRKAEDS